MKLARRVGTQENCVSRKEFSPVGIWMNHRAKMARGKEHGLQRQVNNNSTSGWRMITATEKNGTTETPKK
jgi:hypothetical protein